MINAEQCFIDMINAPARKIRARVELHNGSTLLNTFKYTDLLKEITIERVGEESKFFGFGVCQKLNVKLIDKDRKLSIDTSNFFDVAFGADCDYIYCYPYFNVTEVHRDENTNELSITAYDNLYSASAHNVSELVLPTAYTIKEFAIACASLLGIAMDENVDSSFNTIYPYSANFEGSETIREALDRIAEATQTIYYIDSHNRLVFKRLDIDGNAVYTIDKSRYIELESKGNRRLSKIVHATELGDNVSVEASYTGSTQYVRNNPFWDLREDIDKLLEDALAAIGGITINQYECNWRGNFLLEIGDKIALTTKDNQIVYSYLLDDVITYNGFLSEESRWSYTDNEDETEDNPTNLGDALKLTYARVDKANKQIEIVASDVSANKENISSLQMNTESITATVSNLEKNTAAGFESVNGDIEGLTEKVSATMTAEQVKLEIQSEYAKGANKVTTSTGFTFNDDGLTVEKSNSEMKTMITEDGMQVFKNDDAVLTANNVGVNALNLHATTYLIIGNNSRFEDYGSDRTGCFWIGG